ncbi:MAG: AtpZ/AtpI family protein [Candidatus Kerfeldbacteria bacterium]|nr:AtpZ/AtpI family protein [Candidatus Kerfeldbacteria bacterium]
MDNYAPGMTKDARSPFWQALNLAWELGWMIVVPLVMFGLGGRLADRTLGTSPWLLLSGMAIAVAATTLLLIRKFRRLLKDIEQSSNRSDRKP